MKLKVIAKRAGKKLKKAEKSGALERWKTRFGLGVQVVEVAMLATAAAKGLKIGKGAKAPPVRRVRAGKKRAAAAR